MQGNGAVKDLTVGEPARLIFYFTLPLLAGNVFQQLFGFVDTLIVGRFLGVEALAAVGCTGSLMFLMLGFIGGMTSGFSICTGQSFGAKDFDGVRKSAAICIALSFAASIVLTIFGVAFCRDLLIAMDTPPEILDGAYSFIVIVYGGVIMFVFLQMLTNLIRALGDSKMPTVIQATTLCINILLEPIAIIGLGLGIPGSAGATIVALTLGNILCIIYIKKRVPYLHVRREDFSFDRKSLLEHIKIGLPMGFQSSIIAIGAVVLQIALNGLGSVAVAAFAAAHRVDGIAIMPMMSFGIAMAAYTAQNFGAKQFGRIVEGVKKCVLMSCSFSILVAIFNIYLGAEMIELFVGAQAQQVVEYGRVFLIITGLSYWALALLFIFRFTLQGLGQSFVPTLAGIVELVMRIAAAIFLVEWLGFLGACLAAPMAWIGGLLPLAVAFIITVREQGLGNRD
ncbi:MAG: MATE family efflux transporter [Selenomonadaceae bacterium]|nr:MATE family efflux transporter [Selenomonadaceae bacterium]